jgi:hypothetical protein
MNKPSKRYRLNAQLISPVFYMAKPVSSVGKARVALQSVAKNAFLEGGTSEFVLVGLFAKR